MTRSQRIALAMRGYGPRHECELTGVLMVDISEQGARDFLQSLTEPRAFTKRPHTFSVFVRGERGLPCS